MTEQEFKAYLSKIKENLDKIYNMPGIQTYMIDKETNKMVLVETEFIRILLDTALQIQNIENGLFLNPKLLILNELANESFK